MKNDKYTTVRLGDRDENGNFKVPYTHYGLIKNIRYIFQKIWKYSRILVVMYICGAFTQSIMRYL